MSRHSNTIAALDGQAVDCFGEPAGGLPEQGPFSILARQGSAQPFALAFLNKELQRGDLSFPTGSNKRSHRDTQRTNENVGYEGRASGYQDGAIFPIDIEPGQTFVVDPDGGGNEVATFDAAAAFDQTAAGPFDLEDGWTLTFRIDGAAEELQTFTIAAANVVDIDAVTAAELIREFNLQARGCSAGLQGAADVRITSDKRGTDSRVIIVGGTMAATLNFDGETVGTGDVADIENVTAAEFKTVVEADTTAVCTILSDNRVRVSSPTTGAASTLEVDGASTIPAATHGYTEDSVAGTGTGSAVPAIFTGQALANTPVAPFSARVHGPDDANDQQHYDKYGDGKLYIRNDADPDAETESGAIDYNTGDIEFTYTAVPSAGEILVDYVSTQQVGVAGQAHHRLAFHVDPIGAGKRLAVWAVGLGGAGRVDVEVNNMADGLGTSSL